MAYKLIHAKKEIRDVRLTGYVNIDKPDVYDPEKPKYKFSTELNGEVAEQLVSAIDNTITSAAVEMGSKPSPKRPYKRLDDGSVQFNFHVREFEEGKRPFKLWDMRLNTIEDVPTYTAGTVVNLNFAFYVSEFRNVAYIGLQPTHIQIKEAVVYDGGGRDVPTFGAGDFDDAPTFAAGEVNVSHEDF